MDDKIFLAAIIYLFVSITVVAFLPDDFFQGSKPEQFNTEGADTGNIFFVTKIARFLFAGWTIEGIPAIIGTITTLINLLVIIVASIYIYDKIRGI